jgi:hypothetical protein
VHSIGLCVKSLTASFLLVASTCLPAQNQASKPSNGQSDGNGSSQSEPKPSTVAAPSNPCLNLVSYPAVVVPGAQPQALYYCKDTNEDENGSFEVPIHLKNSSPMTVIVKGINPLMRSFVISINGTKYAETDGRAILGFLGVSSPATNNQPAKETPIAGAPPRPTLKGRR